MHKSKPRKKLILAILFHFFLFSILFSCPPTKCNKSFSRMNCSYHISQKSTPDTSSQHIWLDLKTCNFLGFTYFQSGWTRCAVSCTVSTLSSSPLLWNPTRTPACTNLAMEMHVMSIAWTDPAHAKEGKEKLEEPKSTHFKKIENSTGVPLLREGNLSELPEVAFTPSTALLRGRWGDLRFFCCNWSEDPSELYFQILWKIWDNILNTDIWKIRLKTPNIIIQKLAPSVGYRSITEKARRLSPNRWVESRDWSHHHYLQQKQQSSSTFDSNMSNFLAIHY